MTNNQHRQVPEALIDLIDAYAETRHRCGGIYNARTEAARNAVIEALSGVRALSAAPAAKKSALRTYPNPIVPLIKPVSEQEKMRALYLASSNLMAYLGRNGAIHSDGHAADAMMDCLNDLDGGGFDETLFAASPTPPAEQQAQPDECFPGEPKVAVPQGLIGAACFAIRNKRDGGKVLEQLRRYSVGDRSQPLTPQQAAPKAAPGEPSYSEKWDAELGRTAMRFADRAGDVHPGIDDAETICAEFHKAMSEVIERMPHVQRMTPRKAAPMSSINRLIAYSAAEKLRELGFAWDEEAEAWLNSAAPQQEAQEPSKAYAWVYVNKYGVEALPASKYWCTAMVSRHGGSMFPLYTAPQPAPLSDDVVRDAARWRMVALIGNEVMLHPEKRTHATAVKAYMDATHSGSDLTGAVDAALAAQGGKA